MPIAFFFYFDWSFPPIIAFHEINVIIYGAAAYVHVELLFAGIYQILYLIILYSVAKTFIKNAASDE
jgi:hypothetical protein